MDEMRLVNVLIYVFVAWVNFGGHFLPWHVVESLADDRGRLHRLAAYVYGTLAIFVGFIVRVTIWQSLGMQPSAREYLTVNFLIILSAGIGTLLAYGLDVLVEHRALQGDLQDYETYKG
jgi:hypothetical protein